jgi:hypothetical protein
MRENRHSFLPSWVGAAGRVSKGRARDASKAQRVWGVTMRPSQEHEQAISPGELNGVTSRLGEIEMLKETAIILHAIENK